MANLNGYLMNNSVIEHDNPIAVDKTGFTFNGNCILDNTRIVNYSMTENEAINDSVSNFPTWKPNVLFLCNYNYTTDGSNIFGISGELLSWDIYRHEVNSAEMYPVALDLPLNYTEWVDYKAESNKKYEYYFYVKSTTQISNPIITDYIIPCFYGYFLIDASPVDSQDGTTNENVTVYKIDENVKSDKITNNTNTQWLQNYTQYDTPIQMKRNFLSSSFTGLLYPKLPNKTSDYYNEQMLFNDIIDNFRAFINNGQPKYLKLRSGKMIKVLTAGNNGSSSLDIQYEDDIGFQPINVTVYYTEIAPALDTTKV